MNRRPVRRRRIGPPLRFALPRWAPAEAGDPFGAVLGIHEGRQTVVVATLAAALLYGAVVFFGISSKVAPPPAVTVRTELPVIETPRPPPPPAAPVVEEPRPAPQRPIHRRVDIPPPPAQAAQVVTRTAEAPADLENFDIATGHAEAYAGGYTAPNGTSRNAVATPPAEARSAPRSGRGLGQARAAQPVRRDWRCAWPEQAEDSDLRETRVAVTVEVSPDGDPLAAQVQGSALPGFAEAARHCALSEQYRPALDDSGRRVAARTPLLVVHFVR